MTRFLRWLFRGLLAGLALVAVALLATLGPVDRTSWPETPLAAPLAASLATLKAQTNAHAFGPLAAGFGRARLTPTLGAPQDDPAQGVFRALPLAGYGQRRGRPATGVHDDLWVKAVALAVAGHTGVVVSADALIIPREVAEATAALLRVDGLARTQLYFSASHSHCSIGGWGEGLVAEAFAGGYQAGVRVWFAQQLAAAARTALADLAPAEAGSVSLAATDFVRNRLDSQRGRVEPALNLLVVRQANGRRAVLGSYGAHATVLPGSFMEYSADYPGVWQRELEREPQTMAVFLGGAVGSHGPRPGASGWDGVERLGRGLAELSRPAVTALRLTNRVVFGLSSLSLPLPELQARLSDGIRLRLWAARRLLPVADTAMVQALRLGDAVWLSTPCDFSGELVLDLKAGLSQTSAQTIRTLAVTSFNGDYVGYVIPAEYYHLGGYEPRTMSFFGPQLPGYLSAALRGLCELASAARAE
jgi:hypothetical protein